MVQQSKNVRYLFYYDYFLFTLPTYKCDNYIKCFGKSAAFTADVHKVRLRFAPQQRSTLLTFFFEPRNP